MCGIAVFIAKRNPKNITTAISKMTEAICHRGPDGSGHVFYNNLALGHRRLAIIDLSENASQPMSYQNGKYAITYNGEIYNYIEIKAELGNLGYQFNTKSDTEVVLAAYAHWGDKCVERFNGMWAFVIYDQNRQILFGSRDRFGVKPFYFVNDENIFAISSEIRQLIEILPPLKANRKIVTEFLITGFAEHNQETFFTKIQKLPQSHNLIYDLKSHKTTIYPYYEIKHHHELGRARVEEAVDAYASILKNAVKLRLRSDVLVGTCLSGGLDSSSIAAIASLMYEKNTGFNFCAFTAISEQKSNDESVFAELVSRKFNLNWIRIKPTYQDFLDNLNAVVDTQEEPFASPSVYMQYFVMKTSREKGVPVLLDGQGGDETLFGYGRYYAAYYNYVLKRHGLVRLIQNLLVAKKNNSTMSFTNSVKYFLGGLSSRLRYLYYKKQQNYLKTPNKVPCFLSAFSKACLNEFALQKLEINSTNLPLLLRYEDKNSMAHSVETRLPFIDYRVLETALSLPLDLKIRDGWSKWILRKIMAGILPDEVVWRKDKIGFEAPDDIWLQKHQNIMYDTIVSSDLLRSIADVKKLSTVFRSLNRKIQWRLYSTSLWANHFGVTL